MARFLVRVACFCVLQLSIVGIAYWCTTERTSEEQSTTQVAAAEVVEPDVAPEDRDKYLLAIIDKVRLLHASGKSRIIFVGGSNTAFGINSPLIATALRRKPVNAGLHAALGLSFPLRWVQEGVRRGDVVVVMPEYELLLGRPYANTEFAAEMTRLWPPAERYLTPASSHERVAKIGVKAFLDQESFHLIHEWVRRVQRNLAGSEHPPQGDHLADRGKPADGDRSVPGRQPIPGRQPTWGGQTLPSGQFVRSGQPTQGGRPPGRRQPRGGRQAAQRGQPRGNGQLARAGQPQSPGRPTRDGPPAARGQAKASSVAGPARRAPARPRPVYRRSGFNRYGDMVAHYGLPSKPLKGPDRIRPLSKTNREFLACSVELLNEFNAVCRAKGATAYFSYPPLPDTLYERSRDTMRQIHESLAKSLEMPMLTTPEQTAYPPQMFFDFINHLSQTGAQHHSQVLLQSLTPYMLGEGQEGVAVSSRGPVRR